MSEVERQPRACSVARTLEVVGEKWSLLVIREVFLGNRRFEEMVWRIGAPRDTIAARLRTLVEAGILVRVPYSDRPLRHEYRLSPAGKDLYPVIVSLRHWGDTYLADPSGPPLVLEHGDHAFVPAMSCGECGQPVTYRDIHVHPGDRVALSEG
jgi:DNA-binding HxlR family transcriptional regulator